MKATRTRHSWVHMFITHRPTLTLQLHNIDLLRTCHTNSFCTVAWQLARFQLTRRIARSLGDSWASCWLLRVRHITWHVRRLFFSIWWPHRHGWLLWNWVDIPQGTLPREQIFVVFGHFPSDPDAILLCSVSICSISCIVLDFMRIVEVLWIC